MQGSFTKDSEEFKLFNDFYAMVRANWIIEDNNEYWTKAIDDLNKFYKKHGETGNKKSDFLAKLIGNAWMRWLDKGGVE